MNESWKSSPGRRKKLRGRNMFGIIEKIRVPL